MVESIALFALSRLKLDGAETLLHQSLSTGETVIMSSTASMWSPLACTLRSLEKMLEMRGTSDPVVINTVNLTNAMLSVIIENAQLMTNRKKVSLTAVESIEIECQHVSVLSHDLRYSSSACISCSQSQFKF